MNEQRELCFNVPTEKQLADSQKVMTVKEVAYVFSVSEDTIKNCIRRIFPNKMQNGKLTLLNEEEVACISKELKNNSVVNSHLTYEVSSQEIQNIAEKWYSLEDLAKATGYDVATLSNGNNGLLYKDFSFVLEHETRLGGYHNTQKYYSQKVLDALQLYQRQAIVNQGNRSVEQKIEIGKELSIGFLTKTVITSGDKKSAEELCNLIMHNTQETAHNAELQSQVATLKPQAQIANDFIDRNHLTNFRDASNILKIKQSDFMKILAEKYVYKNSIGEYRCYAEYEKYFSLRPFQKGIEKTGQQLMLTLDGLEFFKNKIFTEVKQ